MHLVTYNEKIMKKERYKGLNFRDLAENAGDIFVVTDGEFTIRYVSSTISEFYGIDPVAIVGQNLLTFVKHDNIEVIKDILKDLAIRNSYEIALEFQQGVTTYFDVHIAKSADSDFMLKLHDITRKKSKEEELINTNKQLDQVIYKTTHDLKAPLMSAIGLLNLAEKAPADQHPEYLALIKRSLLRLSSFIEEMNNFFRNEKLALQREKIEVGKLLQEEIENLKNLFQAGKITITLRADEQGEFFSDLVRVKTIATNILTNAIKYADSQKDNPFIQVEVKVNADYCEITFADNGIGIADEFKEKIFDLFYRATSSVPGTGIGLFIVKDTIERLKGTIAVYSTLGEGTTFTIKIPNQLYQQVQLN
jgi:PAS domain S-box-containing protein